MKKVLLLLTILAVATILIEMNTMTAFAEPTIPATGIIVANWV